MLTVNERKEKYPSHEIEKFNRVSTSTIGHFTDFGFLENFLCTVPLEKLYGKVITVKLSNGDGHPLTVALNHHAREGDIIVIDTSGNKTHACWGEFRSRKAEEINLSAVIIDGAVTDTDYLKTSRIPVFYRSISAKTTKNLKLEGEINTAISVGGTVFESGDYILADQDGIYKFNELNYKGLLEKAIEKEQKEAVRRMKYKSYHVHSHNLK